MKGKSVELTNLERKAAIELGHVLHPAGGLTDDFVYEPIGSGAYVYRTKDGKKGTVFTQVEYEDPEKKKNPRWKLYVEGSPYYFTKKPPKEWLFDTPDGDVVRKWVEGQKQSLPTEKLWNLNTIYLRTFLDFPREHEFTPINLFIFQSWLTELLEAVFYTGVKGEFGGGKTVTGETITGVCRHGYQTGNLSPPFVARAIQNQKITLMVDELDSIAGKRDSDLNSIFRQGYRRGMKYSRVNPDTLETESYNIFSPKLFTVHSDIEEALQSRTIPIHVRETEKLEFPIINLDKANFSMQVYTENFLWYLDNILAFRDNDLHTLNWLGVSVDLVDAVDPSSRGVQHDGTLHEKAVNIRESMFQRRLVPLKEGQLGQLRQLSGRNVELEYVCFALSNLIGISHDEDIARTFAQKLIEEGERSEIGFLGLLRDVLKELFHQKYGQDKYTTADGFVKIANREIYDTFNAKLKSEYGSGVSPAKFKEYLLEFGFTDALNRIKLKVPLPSDPEDKAPQSRLCNVFTARVLRKLGVEQKEKMVLDTVEEVRNWILTNRKDGVISVSALAAKIRELGFDPPTINTKLLKEGIIFDISTSGAWGVSV